MATARQIAPLRPLAFVPPILPPFTRRVALRAAALNQNTAWRNALHPRDTSQVPPRAGIGLTARPAILATTCFAPAAIKRASELTVTN